MNKNNFKKPSVHQLQARMVNTSLNITSQVFPTYLATKSALT